MDSNELQQLRDYYNNFEANKIITVLDTKNNNIYSTYKYTELMELQPEDIFNKNLVEFTDNRYAMGIVNISQNYLKLMQFKKSKAISAILKWDTALGVKVFLVEVSRIKLAYYKIEFNELQTSLITDMLHIVNQIDIRTNYKKKVILDEKKITPIASHYFNEQEEIILFLISIGKSHKEIANVLTKLYVKEMDDAKLKRIIYNAILPKINAFNINEAVFLFLASSSNLSIPEKLINMIDFKGVYTITYNNEDD